LVLTAGDRHLLDKLPAPKGFYEHVPVDEDPAMLGFACRDALARHVGRADYFCYLEHDLIPHDPLLFLKLGWFTRYAGNIAVLLPQRFELTRRGPFRKVYVDGDLVPEATADFQDASEQAELHARVMDEHIVFRRALNPYAGCWFLNAAQMEHWTSQPYFADRDASFLGPMQSAAALGLMRTFRVYKAAPEHAGFLEVERFASEYSPQIGKSVKVAEGPPAPEDTK
jgi:hypothetical protein